MKKTYFLPLLLLLLLVSGCSDYSKVLKSTDPDYKLAKAKEYYDDGQYFKALPIFEELIGVTRGTAKAEEVYYYYARCNYAIGDFYLANYYFNSFAKTYPQSQFAEECLFMAAICSSRLSPPYSLDQSDTRNAINEFQLFMDRYPNSSKRDTCNAIIADLNAKLEKKDFEIASQYVKTEKYNAAVNSLKKLLQDYPVSVYREEVLYLLVESSYLYAEGSIPEKQADRYREAMDNYLIFAAAFPQSRMLRDAEDFYNKSRRKLEKQLAENTP